MSLHRLRPSLALSAFVLLALGSLPLATSQAAPARLSAKQTVQAYVAAINAKSGSRICALLHPVEAKATGYYLGAIATDKGQPIKPAPCRALEGWIGSGGGRDNAQRWRHMTILHMDAAHADSGGVIAIDVKLVDTWETGGRDSESRTTRFYLAGYHGRYVVLRRSSALDYAMWSESDFTADLPPATREPRAADVQIPATHAGCGTPTWTRPDPRGDVFDAPKAAWLDLRSISLSGSKDYCLTLQFEAPLKPGTVVELSIHGTFGPKLLILADGRVYYDSYAVNQEQPIPGVDFGLTDERTLILRFTDSSDIDPKALDVSVYPGSDSEPLIHTQPPVLAGDHYSGFGD